MTLARLVLLGGHRQDAAAAVGSAAVAPTLSHSTQEAIAEAMELCQNALEALAVTGPVSLAMANAHRFMSDICAQQTDLAAAKVSVRLRRLHSALLWPQAADASLGVFAHVPNRYIAIRRILSVYSLRFGKSKPWATLFGSWQLSLRLKQGSPFFLISKRSRRRGSPLTVLSTSHRACSVTCAVTTFCPCTTRVCSR